MNAPRIALSSILFLIMLTPLEAQSQGGRGGCRWAVGNNALTDLSPLSEAQTQTLLAMLEEEKLAHDVYVTLAEANAIPLYRNIAEAESRHQIALKLLATRNTLDVTMIPTTVGQFNNAKYRESFTSLVEQGKKSPLDAAKVGAKIEEMDIADLTQAIDEASQDDAKSVYAQLQRASRNHLRMYNSEITRLGGSYTAEHLSQDQYNQIAASAFEPGGPGIGYVCGNSGLALGLGQGRVQAMGRGNGIGSGNSPGRGKGLGRGNGMGRAW